MKALLGALMLLLVAYPVVGGLDLPGIRFVLDALFFVAVFAALYAEHARFSWKRPVVFAVLVAVALRVTCTVWGGHTGSGGYIALLAATELYTAALLFRICTVLLVRATARPRVDGDVVAGVASVYVLAGVAFASAHIAVFLLHGPDLAYNGVSWIGGEHGGSVLRTWGAGFTYFSFVTQTTLGYGDITPRSDVARGLTIAQTLAGQLYLAIVIARMVAIQLSQERGA